MRSLRTRPRHFVDPRRSDDASVAAHSAVSYQGCQFDQITILHAETGTPGRVLSKTAPRGLYLNLQTLGTLINVDLPWNPSRLEQRLGRIKRFGQRRDRVDMLNLVYQGSIDERIGEDGDPAAAAARAPETVRDPPQRESRAG